MKTVLTWTAKPRIAQMMMRRRSLRIRISMAATIRPGRGSWISEEEVSIPPVAGKGGGGEGGGETPSGTGERAEEEARRQREGGS